MRKDPGLKADRATTKAQILKRLKSEAWYNPPVVIELHARLVKDGRL